MDWLIDCWHIPGRSRRRNYQSCGPCPWGSNLTLWEMISQRGAPSQKSKGCCIQHGRPSYLGQETGSGEDNSQYSSGGLPSHCRHSGGKEDESPGTRMSPKEKEDQTDPCCSMQHQRVHARHIRGWFWGGVEEWKSGESQSLVHGLRMLVGGEDIIEDKADHNFLKMLLVDFLLPEGEVPIEEVIKVPINWSWLEDPGKATDLSRQEEVWGWRSIYPSSRIRRQKMLWPTAHGSGMWLSSTTQGAMINTCCHMSSGHYKGSWEILLGV